MTAAMEASVRAVTLEAPLQAGMLDTLRLTLYGVAVRMGFAYEAIEDLKVAVSEACNYSLMQLDGTDAEEARMQVVFRMEPAALSVQLGIEGAGVAFGAVLPPQGPSEVPSEGEPVRGAAEDLSGLDSGRMGLYLMQALVDEVRVQPAQGEHPERLLLIKRRPAQADGY